MKLLDFISIALSSLRANKLRSALTMLGMIIGVGAVIALMSIGRGVQAQITSIYEQQGSNVVIVQPRNPEAPGIAGISPLFVIPSLDLGDANAIAEIPSVSGVAPTNENFVEVAVGDESTYAVAQGSTPAFLDAYAYNVASGQFFSERNVLRRDLVVVLGSKIAGNLFGTEEPVGEKVRIKGKGFTVIGVLEPKGGAFMGFSLDDIVVTPITTFQTRLFTQQMVRGESSIQSIAVKVSSADAIDSVMEDIENVLRVRHRIGTGDKDDFAIISQEQVLAMFQQIAGILTIFLGAVAGISLIVGSIGIMNIMLVSVTERTREIGIRKAIGAKRRDILNQFLLEAAMLSMLGGGIGIVAGWLVSKAVSLVEISGMKVYSVVSPEIIVLAISVSVFIGLASGIYPAMRAARLNPIDALHYG